MACFTAPLAEAIIVSAVKKIVLKKTSSNEKVQIWRNRISVLEQMLYGGSFLLAVEHIYHGEVVLYPPFLTAMQNPADIPSMLHEIATVGVGMSLLTTAVWAAGCMLAPHFKSWLAGRTRTCA